MVNVINFIIMLYLPSGLSYSNEKLRGPTKRMTESGKFFGEFGINITMESAPDGGQMDEILFDIFNLLPLECKTSNFEEG